jgi:long-chain fatty acid transport protein
MAQNILKLAAVAFLATTSFAQAGGYSRGSANLDPLLEEGIAVGTTFAIVAPNRGYSTINGVAASRFAAPGRGAASDKFSETYTDFSGTAAIDIVGGVRCAGSFAQPFGADANYGWSQLLGGTGTTTSSSLGSTEFGATCSYGFTAGPGKLHILGGLFLQQVEYDEARAFGFGSPLGGGDIRLNDTGYGYRIGAAYTIPEYAVKASLVYRSSVSHELEGLVRNPAFGPLAAGLPSFANAKTPASVKLSLQTGVAPGWLVFGSVEWTDWSVLQQIQVFSKPGTLAAIGVPLTGVTVDAFFRDGLTVSGGVGHQFNDALAGSLSLTWDRGVSKGRNVSSFSDVLTIAAGGSYKINDNVSLRGGLAFSRLGKITENQLDGDVIGFGNDSSIAGGISLVGKF